MTLEKLRELAAKASAGDLVQDEAGICTFDGEMICMIARPEEYWASADEDIPEDVADRLGANAALLCIGWNLARALVSPEGMERMRTGLHNARFRSPITGNREPTPPDAGDTEYANRLLAGALNALLETPNER